MAKRVRRSASSRSPKNNVWTTITAFDNGIATGVSQSFPVVLDEDWSGAAGQERATILRIRGWLMVTNKTTTGVRPEGTWAAYITVQDEDAPVASAAVASTYTDEDILWTSGGMFTLTDTNATGIVSERVIDVKAMRKIRIGQTCRLVITNLSDSSLENSVVLRALLRKGGN